MSFQVFQAQGLRIYTGDTATVNQYVGLAGELAITTDNKSIRILDGINPGGTPLTTANGAELQGLNIEQLANLLVSAPQDGQALVYEGGKWKNKAVAASGSGGASHVNDLVDVKLTNLQTGEVLSYNASIMKWENKAVAAADHNHDSKYQLKGNYLRDTSNLGEVNDVQITMPADGQSLVYDAGKWINTTVAEGSGGVDGITSVDGNVIIGTSLSSSHKVVIEGGIAGANSSTLALKTGSGTSSRVADLSFWSTFYNHADTGNRRTADITAGYSTGVWGTEYLAFCVGGADDYAYLTTERMRIDSSGNVIVGGTTFNASDSISFTKPSSQGCTMVSPTTGTTNMWRWYNGNGNVGTISISGTSTTYSTASDYRLKEDWQPMSNSIDRVKALNPVNFAWKADGSRADGFLAHEAQGVVPEAVTGEKDAVNEDGSINAQGIDQSKLVPLLTAALQETITLIESQQSQIDSLEARLAALEAKLS